jgi:hypothetical protein
MKNFGKNILLLIAVLALSYFTAPYFGSWYDKFSPLVDRSLFALNKIQLQFMTGLPFSFIFFLIIIFCSTTPVGHKKLVGWLLVPPFLFFGSGDITHIYLPILLALVAWGLATLLRKIFHRNVSPQIQQR